MKIESSIVLRELEVTCKGVSFPFKTPHWISINHAYSRVSSPSGTPLLENMACPRNCNPDNVKNPFDKWK